MMKNVSIRKVASVARVKSGHRVNFTDGVSALTTGTASNGLENSQNFGVPVFVEWTKAGKIAELRPVW